MPASWKVEEAIRWRTTCMAVALAVPLEGACICGAAKGPVSGSIRSREAKLELVVVDSWARFYRPAAAHASLYWSPVSFVSFTTPGRRSRRRRWTRPRLQKFS